MGLLDYFKNKTIPSEEVTLNETYPVRCVESKNNRAFLERFFDVTNKQKESHLGFTPNCPHCNHTFQCVIGLHVNQYLKSNVLNNFKQPDTNPKSEVPHKVEPKSRFESID
jgi:hypothetical protein